MAKTTDPRDNSKPEPRPARDKTAERTPPPKPAPKSVFSDWAMI